MDYQDRYDELDNIISSLNILIDEISDKSYIEQLQEIKYQAEDEMQEVEEKLQEEYKKEECTREQEYLREAI